MRSFATGLLIGMAVLFVVARSVRVRYRIMDGLEEMLAEIRHDAHHGVRLELEAPVVAEISSVWHIPITIAG